MLNWKIKSGETEGTGRIKRTGAESDGPGWNPASWLAGHIALRTELLGFHVEKIQPQHSAPRLGERALCDPWIKGSLGWDLSPNKA